MQFQALGGAGEVGASGYLLRIAGRSILVDCGIRVNKIGTDSLPDLSALPRKLDLVLLTHAHMDHSGALPILRAHYPTTSIITTPPTLNLIKILLADAVKIMKFNADRAEPLYDGSAVQQVIRTIETQEFHQWFMPLPDIAVCLTPAGHILGAASVLLDTPEGKIVCSGDVSVSHQRTVPGIAPPDFAADWMVLESTYGYGTHPDRAGEERALAKTVGEVVVNGGIALVPSFALGRAQEVLLCLRQLQEQGALPLFPVFADGMVRVVSDVYDRHVRYLAPNLQERAAQGDFIFWTKEIQKVNPKYRHFVGREPCCIVASSGMLSGGPSVGYARRLVGDDRNAILITGYTDEESPGRKLQELEQGDTIRLNGEEFPLRCQVKRVNLSAHADQTQLVELARHYRPHDVILVHGEEEARATLGDLLYAYSRVSIPRNGEPVNWDEPRWWGGWSPTGRHYDGLIVYTANRVSMALSRDLLTDDTWRDRYLGHDAVQVHFLGQHLVIEPTVEAETVQAKAGAHLAGEHTVALYEPIVVAIEKKEEKKEKAPEMPPEVAEALELLGLSGAELGAEGTEYMPHQSSFPCIVCSAAKRYRLDFDTRQIIWRCSDCGRRYTEMIKNLKKKDWNRLNPNERLRLNQFTMVSLYLYEKVLPTDWKERAAQQYWEKYLDLVAAPDDAEGAEKIAPAPQMEFPCIECGGPKRYQLDLGKRQILWQCASCGHAYTEMLLNLKQKDLDKLDDDEQLRLLQFAAVSLHLHEPMLSSDWLERVAQRDWERYWEQISE